MNIRVVELDGAVVDVAERWFGFSRAGVDVTVGDGLAAFDDAAAADVVVIDVDAKDASLGMSCPPAAFLEPAYLQKVKRTLRPGGVCIRQHRRALGESVFKGDGRFARGF